MLAQHGIWLNSTKSVFFSFELFRKLLSKILDDHAALSRTNSETWSYWLLSLGSQSPVHLELDGVPRGVQKAKGSSCKQRSLKSLCSWSLNTPRNTHEIGLTGDFASWFPLQKILMALVAGSNLFFDVASSR